MRRLRQPAFHGCKDKLFEVGRLFSDYLKGDVLDVGYDTRYLAKWVQGRYIRVDIDGSPNIQINDEGGLPFHDKGFDTVVAFDILEHCDSIHFCSMNYAGSAALM